MINLSSLKKESNEVFNSITRTFGINKKDIDKLVSMAKNNSQGELKVGDLFPYDRVLDVQITVDSEDWDTIRYQSRNFF